jgi:7-carboxy-7-deazaguanine synthase (Cx14CxxC type)
VKEIFYTLQGEGARTGRAAVFCRFTGCNLWSGREIDRATAKCQFCDTDFIGVNGTGGGKFQNAIQLAQAIKQQWHVSPHAIPYVVLTGGEPLLQVDEALLAALHAEGFEIAIETNGTLPVPDGVDWICVSPKADTTLLQITGDELKLIYPQVLAAPERFNHLQFTHFFLQPLDDAQQTEHVQACIRYCLAYPQWRLSLQTHKLLNIP